MYSLSCRGPGQIVPCTMHRQSCTVLLRRSLAHYSCSWPTQLDQAVIPAYTSVHMLVVAHCKCKLLKLSQLFERGGIYRIEWRLAKSKLSNELEHGGAYRMMYDTYKHRYKHRGERRLTSVGLAQAHPNYTYIYIDSGECHLTLWGSIALTIITHLQGL